MGAHLEALEEGILLFSLDPWYTQIVFNLISVQVCLVNDRLAVFNLPRPYCALKLSAKAEKQKTGLKTLYIWV